MEKFLFFILLISTRVLAQSGWYTQSSGTSQKLNSVYFTDSISAYIVGDNGTILKTTNGGTEWNQINNQIQVNIYDAYFSDMNNGIIICDSGKIFNTNNAGIDWIEKSLGINDKLSSLEFIDTLNGYIVGKNGLILKTSDGGKNWVSIGSSSFLELRDLSFINKDLGFIVGRSHKFRKTTDGGNNWFILDNPSVPWASWDGVDYVNESIAFVVGDFRILKTTNTGDNWTEMDLHIFYSLHKIKFSTDSIGFIVGDYSSKGIILKTTDCGQSWIEFRNSIKYTSLYGIFIYDNYNATAVGENGTVLRTKNGGVTFIEDENNILPKEFSLFQNYPNPFNPSTSINYQLPIAGNVSLKVYDVLGNEVTTLVNEYRPAGSYEVEFKSTLASHQLANGVYFYQLKAGDFVETKKMILLK